MMDSDTLFPLALAFAKKGGGGGGSLIPVPTAQDAGKMLIVGVVQGEAGYQLVAFDEPMKFKGTLGTGGTISTLPTASSSNEGYVYIVITDGTYAGQTAKAGDTFISDGSAWVLVPSADEPSVIDDSVTSTALTWSSKKISDECKIKSFTYTGTDTNLFEITVPDDAKYIVSIQGDVAVEGGGMNSWFTTSFINLSKIPKWLTIQGVVVGSGLANRYYSIDRFTNHKLQLTATGNNAVLNILDAEYTVYYI